MSNSTTRGDCTAPTSDAATCCPTTGAPGDCCPVEASIARWQTAFGAALHQTQTEILAAKIREQWGEILEQEADAVIAAMGVCWQTTLAKAKSQVELRETFQTILSSAAG